jgi:Bacteriophage tail sheath protein
MVKLSYPGVYLQEIDAGVKSIEGVDTSTAAFVGVTERGPKLATLISSYADFTTNFGEAIAEIPPELRDKWAQDLYEGGQWWQFPLSVKGFFDNGGKCALIKRVYSDNPADLTADDFVAAIQSLTLPLDASLCVANGGLCLAPGMWSTKIQSALISRCEACRCFTILDPPPDLDLAGIREFRKRQNTSFAALYYPWLEVAGNQVAPSGHIAGIYARVDGAHGVYKAPANEEIRGIKKFARDVTDREQELLNGEGVNALRFFPAKGNLVWGARTASTDPEWKYVNVRRFFIYLERSIDLGTQWTVFEPNNERTWANVRRTIEDFLLDLWQAGALQGNRPEEAFFVKCDRTTMTQNDLDNGRLICLVGVAVMKPAEFVIFRIGQWTAEHQS